MRFLAALLRRSPVASTRVRWRDIRVHHHGECPDGYGAYHPRVEWVEYPVWKWYMGGVIEKLDLLGHLIPIVRLAWCPRVCARLVGDRGPWMPLRRGGIDIPWEAHPLGRPDR